MEKYAVAVDVSVLQTKWKNGVLKGKDRGSGVRLPRLPNLKTEFSFPPVFAVPVFRGDIFSWERFLENRLKTVPEQAMPPSK